jgi:phytoene synthase
VLPLSGSDSLLSSLPLPQRIALTDAPAKVRAPTLALLAFDARLGQAVRQASEPIVGQMRLAWWNDQLRLEADRRERSDELVVALDLLAGARGALHALVDGWELLLGDRFDAEAIEGFADARAGALAGLARLLHAPDGTHVVHQAARRWALADVASGLGNTTERDAVLAIAKREPAGRERLSRTLRPLAVLSGLARRSLARGGAPLLDGPASLLLAMRLGLAGR